MGQVLHGSATTTEAIRRAIQHSQESLRALAKRYGINPKTVAKWKKRTSVADLPTGPKEPVDGPVSRGGGGHRRLSKHTLLPLDDCLYALQATIPHLTRSSLHRCLQRHGISRLPEVEGDKPAKKRKFKAYPIGYFHIDIAEVRTAEGKLYLFVAIDRTSKFAFVELHEKATGRPHGDFLRPHRGRPLQGPHRPDRQRHPLHHARRHARAAEIKAAMMRGTRSGPTPSNMPARERYRHRLTKPKHPWTNGQVERMNRTIKDATVKRYLLRTHEQLDQHLDDFVNAYNFARRLKTLKGLTPYEFICKAWT